MPLHPHHVFVATLGGQPQIVTLALDQLLAQGVPINEVVVVHLALDNPRYQASLHRLAGEFVHDCYAGQTCRYRPLAVRLHTHIVADLDSELAFDATRETFARLFADLKRQEYVVHLCPTGGRRMLGHMAMLEAQRTLAYTDRAWHLHSPDCVREQTRDGALLHVPATAHPRLLRVAFPHYQPVAAPGASAMLPVIDPAERARCQQVYDALTARPRDVLRAFAAGRDPAGVAAELCISIRTVDSHKTVIFAECCNAWNLAPDTHLRYAWLREKFAAYFEV